MVHRSIHAGVAVLGAALWMAAAPNPEESKAPPQAARPNFVMIVLDDFETQSLWVLEQVQKRLATEGASFEQHFVSLPLCCPSRASIFTGQFAHNHGVLSNVGRFGGLERFRELKREAETLPVWLQRAGYRTGLVGKYLNHYGADRRSGGIPPGWNSWHAILEDRTASNGNYWMNDDGRLSQGKEYQTDRLARLGAEFVTAQDARPFFLYVAPGAPHLPADPAPEHASAFLDLVLPRSPSFDEQDVSDKPAFLRKADPLNSGDVHRLQRFYRRRLQTLLSVDALVVQILDALERAGRLHDTYVFFTSDNGYLHGQHRFPGGKNAPYEEAIKVPLIVRGPAVPRAVRLDQLVSNVDYAPTLLELAGLAVPASVDGQSFAPLLRSDPPPADRWRQAVLVEHWETGDPFPIPTFHLLRLQHEVYVEYITGESEYYDLRLDPYQLENGQARLTPSQRQRLSERLAALQASVGAACGAAMAPAAPPPAARLP